MNLDFERAQGKETIKLSRWPGTVALVVALMSLLLVMQVVIVFLTRPVPLPLMGLLALAAGSASWLGLIAVETILPTTVEMDKDGIKVSRLLGGVAYEWADVSAVRLVPSGGMLSDDPRTEASGRLAVGLFVKSRKTPRLHELDADFVLYGASEDHLSTLNKLIDHILDFKNTVGAGRPDPSRRIRKAAPIVAATSFRRPRSAA